MSLLVPLSESNHSLWSLKRRCAFVWEWVDVHRHRWIIEWHHLTKIGHERFRYKWNIDSIKYLKGICYAATWPFVERKHTKGKRKREHGDYSCKWFIHVFVPFYLSFVFKMYIPFPMYIFGSMLYWMQKWFLPHSLCKLKIKYLYAIKIRSFGEPQKMMIIYRYWLLRVVKRSCFQIEICIHKVRSFLSWIWLRPRLLQSLTSASSTKWLWRDGHFIECECRTLLDLRRFVRQSST